MLQLEAPALGEDLRAAPIIYCCRAFGSPQPPNPEKTASSLVKAIPNLPQHPTRRTPFSCQTPLFLESPTIAGNAVFSWFSESDDRVFTLSVLESSCAGNKVVKGFFGFPARYHGHLCPDIRKAVLNERGSQLRTNKWLWLKHKRLQNTFVSAGTCQILAAGL